MILTSSLYHYYGNTWNSSDYFLGSTKNAKRLALMIFTTIFPIYKNVSEILLSTYHFCHIVRIKFFD